MFYFWVVKVLTFCTLAFHFLDSVLWCTDVFNFHESCSFIFFVDCSYAVISKNPFQNPSSYRFTHMLSPENFSFSSNTCLRFFKYKKKWFNIIIDVFSKTMKNDDDYVLWMLILTFWAKEKNKFRILPQTMYQKLTWNGSKG